MPAPPPPPLTPWGHVWRYLVMVLISAVAWFELAVQQWEQARWWFWTDLAIGAACFAVVWWRREHPVVVATVTTLASAVSGAAGGPATLALFSLATRRRWRELVPLALLSYACGIVLTGLSGIEESTFLIATTMVAVIGVTVALGLYVGSRRELLETLRERARTAETEQSARVAQARTAERARIAREMHDVLAHRISLVTMHAGALTYRKDLSPEQVHETAGVIRDNAHQALTELREVLGVLREDSGDARPELPQPDATHLEALFEEARRSGMHLEVEVCDVDLDTVPSVIGRTAYRVVQEGLTNARKHAPDTLVTVSLTGAPGGDLVVQVRNHLPLGTHGSPPRSGLGLIGLRERTELAGGRLRQRAVDHQFVLEVALPWPA